MMPASLGVLLIAYMYWMTPDSGSDALHVPWTLPVPVWYAPSSRTDSITGGVATSAIEASSA